MGHGDSLINEPAARLEVDCMNTLASGSPIFTMFIFTFDILYIIMTKPLAWTLCRAVFLTKYNYGLLV